MSAIALIWAANVKGLKPATKIVLIQLSERHNKDSGRCDPRLSLLADDCEMSRASLLRHLSVLEEQGFITRVAQGRDNGGRTSTQYDLHMGQRSQIETGGKGLICDGQRSHLGGGKGLTDETPYIEPVLNQEEPNARDRADYLFSENETQEKPDSTVDLIEVGFKEFWELIWPAHKRKTGKVDCAKVYAQACLGKHPKAEQIAPGTLNRAAKAYIASVDDRQYLKGPLPWLRQPGWEAHMNGESESPPPRRFMAPAHGEVVR